MYRPQTNHEKTENVITANAMRLIKKTFPDAFITKIHGGGYQRAGLPDVYISVRGRSIWVEMKRPGADTTALQRAVLKTLASTGAFCGTAESPERAVTVVTDALASDIVWKE